ncbi:MAG TPA: alpha/beta hydrolase [Chloroflexota bacterium]|nr:alpha/beta hydrolase [Chloroflexota bacterium]
MTLTEGVFQTGEVAINYAEGPRRGDALVVLHGGATRWQYGQALLEALAATWHVYAPDFRGHGLSGHVPGAYGLRDYVRDTAVFLAGVVREPAVVYGHSLGGEVGVMLAAEYPPLVRAVIVGDAPLSNRNHATERPEHRAMNLLWHTLCGRPADEIELALKNMPVLEPGATIPRPAREVMGEDSAYFALQTTSLHQLDPDMLAAVLAGPEVMLEGYVPEVLLPQITCPVLLVQADARHGSALPDDEVALALKLLRRVTHVRLDGLGHPLHGPPGGTQRVLHEAFAPFFESLPRTVGAASPG